MSKCIRYGDTRRFWLNVIGEGPVDISYKGSVVARVDNPDAAFCWLLRNQGQSVAYALQYGGYSVRSA